ncbi:hypothetical protein [Clostridium paraputrificum]|uniref:Uncharacterized protein n=1 Tax=Clostridium paraputrificum TaxID=29363 RepID=A0A6N3F1C2_9CLOT
MREKLKTVHRRDKLFNRITLTLDDNLKYKNNMPMPLNYIYNTPLNNRYIIRCIGASRGCIDVDDNNVITDVRIYHDKYRTDRIYKENVDELLKQFIGYELVIE